MNNPGVANNRRLLVALAGLALLSSSLAFTSSAGGAEEERNIVVFKPGVSPAAQHRVIEEHGGDPIKDLKSVRGVAAEIPISQQDELEAEKSVVRIDPDNLNKVVGSTASSQAVDYGAWKIVKRTWRRPSAWNYNRGAGVKVAVIDTGIDRDHPDLAANIGGGVNTTGGAATDYEDRMGHGTHVAGIIAAPLNGIGTVGVAPSAKIYAVRVFRGSWAYDSDIIRGIDWTVANGMHAINMSLGTFPGASPNPSFQTAIDRAHAAGIVIFAAAGNSGVNTNIWGAVYPAGYRHVIGVSATDRRDRLTYFSNYGGIVDFSAPGDSNYSTYAGNSYRRLSGTSMASPHAAGAAALRISKRLRSGPVLNAAFAELIARDMRVTAYDRGRRGWDRYYGWGIPDGQRLVR